MKLREKTAYLIILALFLLGFANSDTIDYLRVSKRLTFGTGNDSLVVSGGVVTSNSTWRVKSIIGTDTNSVPGNIWYVSPAFTFSKYRKTSASIQMVLDSLGTDSTVIFVYPGTYNEQIIAKTNVHIIGVDKEKVLIKTANDTTVIYCYNVTNFQLKNLTVWNSEDAVSNFTSIKLYRCFQDSILKPSIIFENLNIIGNAEGTGNHSTISGIWADSSAFILRNSDIRVSMGEGIQATNAQIYLRNFSNPILWYNVLKGQTGTSIYIENINCKPYIAYNQMGGDITSAVLVSIKVWECYFQDTNLVQLRTGLDVTNKVGLSEFEIR